MVNGGTSAVWGHAVSTALHTAATSSSTGGGGTSFAFRSTPSTVTLAHFPTHAPQDGHVAPPSATCRDMSTRVLTLPDRHIVSCLSLHEDKEHHSLRSWVAVGTQDQGCYVFPLESERGVLVGDVPPAFESVYRSTTGASSAPPARGRDDDDTVFTLDNKWISKSTGSTTLAAAFVAAGSPSSSAAGDKSNAVASAPPAMLLALVTSTPPAPHREATASQPTSALSVYVSLWGVEGALRKQLLWKSPALSHVAPHEVQGLQCGPSMWKSSSTFSATLAVCTRRGVSLWRAQVTPTTSATTSAATSMGGGRSVSPSRASPSSPASPAATPPLLVEVKDRPCATIPELTGAEYVSLVVPPTPSSSSGSSGVVLALTISGFLVCYDLTDGSVVKWMDCKVCPASRLSCTDTHVIVSGATVRYFTLPAWEFGGKLSPPSLTDAVSGGNASTSFARGGGGLVASSVASSAGGGGFLEALMSGFAIGSVGGGRRGEWLATFYSSGALCLTHAAPSPTSKKAKKLTITKVYTLTPFYVPSTLRGASSTSLLAQQQQQLTPSSVHHRPTTTSGPPRFLPTPRWSPVHLYWSAAAGLRSVCRETAAPLAYRDMESTCATLVRLPLPNSDHHDSTTETTATSITAVVAFDTTFHGLVVMDAMRHFAVIARLPLDTSAVVTSLIAVPLVSSSDGSEASVQNTDMKSARSGATLFGVVPSDASHDQHVRNDAAVIRVDIELFDSDESLTTPANDAACLATVVQRIRREDCGGGDDEGGDTIALLDDACLRMTLRSCRPPRRPQESVGRPEDGEEILQLATTESGAHVCAITGRWVWNVRTGATLHLPVVPSAADILPAVSSGERIFIAGRRAEGVETSSPHQQHLCVINPTDPADIRSYVFPIPAFTSAAAAIGGLQIDDDTKYVSVINDARDEIVVLNMRTKCSEVNRVCSRDTSTIASSAAVFHAFALRGGRSEPPQLIVVTGDEGGTSAATLKMVSVAAADATALPSGVAGPSVGKRSPAPGAAAAVSPPTRSPPPQVPPTSAVAPQRHRDPTVPTSRAAPIASDRSRQQPTNAASTPTERARRAQSCGAEASTQRSPTTAAPLPQAGRAAAANAALSDKFNALQQAIAQNLTPAAIGAATRRQRGSSPPQPESDPAHRQPPAHHSDPNGAPPAAPTSSPASQLIGSRRQDPFRQSGLLLTPQVLENSRTGDVTLRLGMRWSDMTAGGGGGVGTFELPVIRSHNSSICNNSAIDSSMEGVGILHAAMSAVAAGGGGVSTPAAARRPAVESALATELLMRRMHQREAANAAAATPSSSTTIAAVAASSPPHAVAPSRSIAAKDAPKAQAPPGVAKHAATGRYDTLALLDSADLLSPHAKTASTVTDAARGGGDSVVEDDELDITIARRLLAQERKRLDGNFIVGDPPSSPPAPPKEPAPSHKSPTRADDVHVGSAFDDPDTPSNLEEGDFVVCESIVGWPPSAHATGAPAGGPVVTNSEPTFSKSPQRQPYEPDASDDDDHDGDHRRYARGRQGTADPSDFSKDSFDAELFGQQFRTTGPPPRAAFAGVLASVPANSSPMAASSSPSLSPQPQHHSIHHHRSTVAPLETLRPSDSRPQASSSTSTALRQQHRLDEIRRATEAVRRSIATLKDIILEDDDAQDAVGIAGESSSLRDDGGDASASMREWNSVLNDVVTAMWATSQRASTSRPSTAMSSSALQRRPLTAGGAAANSDAVRGTRLTDLAQPAAVSALDITPLMLNTSSNSDGSTVDAAVASAASAAQFQLLWSEMQRMQAQNAELLAAVTRTSR